MKITKVTYQKAFIIGPYLQEKIGVEVEIEPGDNEDTVFCITKDQVDRWHKENNPHLYQNKDLDQLLTEHIMGDPYLHPPKQPAVIDYGKHDGSPQGVLADIQKAKTMEELTPYKLLAAQDKTTYSAYCTRLKELSNG